MRLLLKNCVGLCEGKKVYEVFLKCGEEILFKSFNIWWIKQAIKLKASFRSVTFKIDATNGKKFDKNYNP